MRNKRLRYPDRPEQISIQQLKQLLIRNTFQWPDSAIRRIVHYHINRPQRERSSDRAFNLIGVGNVQRQHRNILHIGKRFALLNVPHRSNNLPAFRMK